MVGPEPKLRAMIVFVDYEHSDGHGSEWGPKLLAARTRITYRLEDLSGQHCMLVRYNKLTPELLKKIDARAIFVSGNGTDPSRYDQASLTPLREAVSSGDYPIFGFCGGFQFLAQTLGSELVPIDTSTVADQNRHLLKPFADGRLGEMGYHPVELTAEHELVNGLGEQPVFRHAHYLEVPKPPRGFTVLASSPITNVQMAVDDDRRAMGTQFHPEYYTDEFPAGKQMIQNFMRWADLV